MRPTQHSLVLRGTAGPASCLFILALFAAQRKAAIEDALKQLKEKSRGLQDDAESLVWWLQLNMRAHKLDTPPEPPVVAAVIAAAAAAAAQRSTGLPSSAASASSANGAPSRDSGAAANAAGAEAVSAASTASTGKGARRGATKRRNATAATASGAAAGPVMSLQKADGSGTESFQFLKDLSPAARDARAASAAVDWQPDDDGDTGEMKLFKKGRKSFLMSRNKKELLNLCSERGIAVGVPGVQKGPSKPEVVQKLVEWERERLHLVRCAAG